MQTFLPYRSFTKSAKVLDIKRLGKQRVEGYQILRALFGYTYGWKHHPATLMWKGHECSLALYVKVICQEWVNQGYEDDTWPKVADMFPDIDFDSVIIADHPWWLGDSVFHYSHQSQLLQKDFDYYNEFWPNMPITLGYVWPDKIKRGDEEAIKVYTENQRKLGSYDEAY